MVEDNPLGTIYFSNKPFPAGGSVEGAKTSFSSNEFIYARLVLKGGTVREVLKPAPPTAEFSKYTLHLFTKILDSFFDDGLVIVNETDLGKTYYDFDVFPSPENASTTGVRPVNNYSTDFGIFAAYHYLTNKFTKEGAFTIVVKISVVEKDFRGNDKPQNEWQTVEQNISCNFNGSDYATIKANKEKLLKDFAGKGEGEKIANQELPIGWTKASSPIIRGLTEPTLRTMYINNYVVAERTGLKIIKFYAAPASSTVL